MPYLHNIYLFFSLQIDNTDTDSDVNVWEISDKELTDFPIYNTDADSDVTVWEISDDKKSDSDIRGPSPSTCQIFAQIEENILTL